MNITLIAATILLQAGAPPDAIFHNARVFTAEPDHPSAEAFAVRDGRITQVGASVDVLKTAGPTTRLVDLAGAFVAPGFSDSHLHFMSGSLTLNEVRLEDLSRLEDLQARIHEYARSHPAAAWVSGRGWTYGAFPGGLPHRKWLDEVVPDRPAFIESYDGHTGWANSKALLLAGISGATRNPDHGEIVRDEHGEATGALKEAAQRLVREKMPRPTDDDKYRALKAGLDLAASYGLTAATNAGFDLSDLPAYERVSKEGGLKLRLYNAEYLVADPDAATLARMKDLRTKFPGPLFRFGAIKALLDGVIESKTAWMLEPYVGGSSGAPNFPVDVFTRSVAAYDREGFQVLVHAIGDRAIRTALDAFEAAARVNHTSGRRHRVEHIEAPQFADLPRFKRLGVIASTQALFATPDADENPDAPGVYFGNLGPERARRTMAFKAIDDAGAVQAFGSDWPVYSLNVLEGIYTALTRQTLSGAPPGGRNPQSRITAEAALRHFTVDGACANFAEKEYGRIAPGLFADFVVLSRDITAIPPEDIRGTRVLLTVMGGKETFRAKDLNAGAIPERQ